MGQEYFTRRAFLKTAVAVAGSAGMAAHGLQFADAQTTDTPQQALRRLVEGNRRFVQNRPKGIRQNMEKAREKTEKKQEPFAAILSCADSRVPVEIIFDQGIGDIFGARVAGNIATPTIIASLEYGAAVLGTKAIVVLGHGDCGAVSATIRGKGVPGQISALYSYIYPAVEQAGNDVNTVSKQNARNQATLLRKASPVLSELVKKGELLVVPAFYHLETGQVQLLTE